MLRALEVRPSTNEFSVTVGEGGYEQKGAFAVRLDIEKVYTQDGAHWVAQVREFLGIGDVQYFKYSSYNFLSVLYKAVYESMGEMSVDTPLMKEALAYAQPYQDLFRTE